MILFTEYMASVKVNSKKQRVAHQKLSVTAVAEIIDLICFNFAMLKDLPKTPPDVYFRGLQGHHLVN